MEDINTTQAGLPLPGVVFIQWMWCNLWNNYRYNISVRSVECSTSLTGNSWHIFLSIPLRRDDRGIVSWMCGAYSNDTLQMLTFNGVVGYILTGTYVVEGIAKFLELVTKPQQQSNRYDIEVSLYEAPASLIPCHQNCEILPTVHLNHFQQAQDTFLKKNYTRWASDTWLHLYETSGV